MYPKLSGVVTPDLVQTIGSGKFSASYVNWSRTMQLLRDNAPEWLPFSVPASDGGIVHRAPVGGYLLIGFRHADGRETPTVPQAVMDHKNTSIQFDQITARDITDTHRRGICLASALLFGLAYELWAKVDIEDPYSRGKAQVSVEDVSAKLLTLKTAEECRAYYKTLPKAIQSEVTDEFITRVKQFEEQA
jgi:hypothetical protein